jgi:hypothetical protein
MGEVDSIADERRLSEMENKQELKSKGREVFKNLKKLIF